MKEIFERESVRRYSGQEVSKEQIVRLLKAAMAAPSARDARPWEFLVVRDKAMLEKLSTLSDYTWMVKDASVCFVVMGNTDLSLLGYCVQDCSAATENLLLEAVHLGLGAVWLGGYPRQERQEKLRAWLDLPEGIVPLWMVAVGYPAQIGNPKDKWDERKVHYERY